jgi:hypothetical protein
LKYLGGDIIVGPLPHFYIARILHIAQYNTFLHTYAFYYFKVTA